jgi:histone chaperone ASF1
MVCAYPQEPPFVFAGLATNKTNRDSEDSAPAEYPPDQPEADTLEDDADTYGAEEAEMQAALEKELAETEAMAPSGAKEEDHDMDGTEEAAAKVKDDEDDDVSDAGSEDLEAESSGSEDEEEEEVEGEGEGEDMEMGDADEKPADTHTNGEKPMQSAEVMVH